MAAATTSLIQSSVPGPAGGNFQGPWNVQKQYFVRDIAQENGSSYIANKSNLGTRPSTDTGGYWTLLVSSGADIAQTYPISGGTY